MKKILVFLIALCSLSLARSQNFVISSASELQSFSNNVNAGNDYAGLTVVMNADIDLEGIAWTPIGTITHPFNGTFDGMGHWIRSLSVNVMGSTTGNVAGLFGFVGSSGTVRCVGIASGSVHLRAKAGENENTDNGASCFVGGIAGLNEGRIEQCANHATIVGNWNMAHVGGIAGASGKIGGGTTSATIEDCYNRGSVFSTSVEGNTYFLGGIVGANDGLIRHVYSCENISNITYSNPICPSGSGSVSSAFSYSTEATLSGTVLDGSLNNHGDYSVWTFAEGLLPTLTCFSVSPTVISLSDDASNASTLSTFSGQTAYVSLGGRRLYKDGDWNTLCLPFNAPKTGVFANATIMELDTEGTYDTDKQTGFDAASGTLYLFFKVASSIEAGKPYIVKWTKAEDYVDDDAHNIVNPLFPNVTISDTPPIGVSSGDGKVTFVGEFSPVSIATEDKTKLFLGSSNSLYYPNDAMYINACRAYFQLNGIRAGDPDDPQAQIRAFVLSFEDETTGITVFNSADNLDNLRGIPNEAWYSIDGRRYIVKPTHHGIYIHNGRKIVLK